MPKDSPDPIPAPKKDILTAAEFSALLQTSDEKFGYRRNFSLHKGGAVDIYTGGAGTVLAVLRYVEITRENTGELTKEIQPLIDQARAKAGATSTK